MNKKLIFGITILALIIAAAVMTSQVYAQVNCSGSIQKIWAGTWNPKGPNNQISCFTFYHTGGKSLGLSLKSDQGKYNLYLAQGANANRLDQKINRLVVYPRGSQKTSVIKNIPAGNYVVAVQPVNGSYGYSLRVDQINMNPVKTSTNSECAQRSEICRQGFNLRDAAVFLGSEAGSGATLPVQVTCPGQIVAEAQWTQGPAEMLVEIFKPGMDRPAASSHGRSPLRVSYNVSRQDLSRGSDWYIELTNVQGGNSNLSLGYEVPAPYCIPSGQENLRKLTMEQGVDRIGEDYYNTKTNNAEACRDMCAQDIRCASFAFSNQDRMCYLKSGVPNPTKDGSCTSGVVAIRVFPLLEKTDYNGMDYANPQTSTAEACRQACIADLRCMAFTFNTQSKLCYLKNGIPQSSRCEICVSGAAIYRQASIEPRTDRFGGDYEHRQLLEPKPELCRIACAQDPRCKAYTFSANDGVCHLKDSTPPTSSCAHCTSGVVQPRTFSFEPDSDRQQSDYYSFENPLNEPEICRLACAQDQRCTTYVYKKPGYQGNTAWCFLKQQTPGQVSDSCCISGVAGR